MGLHRAPHGCAALLQAMWASSCTIWHGSHRRCSRRSSHTHVWEAFPPQVSPPKACPVSRAPRNSRRTTPLDGRGRLLQARGGRHRVQPTLAQAGAQ